MDSLTNFNHLIAKTRMKKWGDIEKVTILKEHMPNLEKSRKTDLSYYKNLERYEITLRKLLKHRIRNILLVSYPILLANQPDRETERNQSLS